MNKQTEQVREFMIVFGQDCPKEPTIPSLEIRKLRAKLILEEALETIEALGFEVGNYCHDEPEPITMSSVSFNEIYTPNLNKVADGLADLHYVAYCGTALACGISNMDEISDEVHRSNMSKLWTEEEIMGSSNNSFEFTAQKVGLLVKCYLVKNKDGKVIKSPSYSPANFTVK